MECSFELLSEQWKWMGKCNFQESTVGENENCQDICIKNETSSSECS